MNTCAICARESADLVADPTDGYLECPTCRGVPPVAKFGPERAYEGAGANVCEFRLEITKALRAKQGDVAYQKQTETMDAMARRPLPAAQKSDVEWRSYLADSERRRRTGAAQVKRSKR